MKTTPEFNLENWTGKTARVKYTETGNFKFYGYLFFVTEFAEVHDGFGYRELHGSDWTDALTTLTLDSDSLEEAIIAAVRFIANRV